MTTDARSAIRESALLLQSGQPLQAKQMLEAILGSSPQLADAKHLLGICLFQLGDPERAARIMRELLQQAPHRQDIWVNYVLGLAKAVDYQEEMLRAAGEALSRFPQLSAVWLTVAKYYDDRRDWRQASRVLQQAVDSVPQDVGLRLAWARCELRLGNTSRAQALLGQLEMEVPSNAEVPFLLGKIAEQAGDLDLACACWSRALAIQPEHAHALEQLVIAKRRCCDWIDADALADRLRAGSQQRLDKGQAPLESPLVSLSLFADNAYNFRVARAAACRIAEKGRGASKPPAPTARGNKIRVGYLSDELRDHPTGLLLRDFFQCHDQNAFECVIYMDHAPTLSDEITSRISAAAWKVHNIHGWEHQAVAQKIADDQIDVLVDLKGWRSGNRLQLFALRPASIQVTFLGYPGTTGADFFDYLIADDYVLPVDQARYFSERPAYVNRCYLLGAESQPTGQTLRAYAGSRRDHNLPESGLVLVSFNQAYKLDPAMMSIWFDLLHDFPESVLWLWPLSPSCQRNLGEFAAQHQIDPARLVFADWKDHQQHMARLTHADLYLDTRIYTGHTTTADALVCQVPAVALSGEHFASRVSASLLRQVGLQSCVVDSLEEYRDLARHLLSQPEERARIRSVLTEENLRRTLLNTADFVRDLEDLFQQMLDARRQAGEIQALRARQRTPLLEES